MRRSLAVATARCAGDRHKRRTRCWCRPLVWIRQNYWPSAAVDRIDRGPVTGRVIIGVSALALVGAVDAGPPPDERAALVAYEQTIANYVALHRQVERHLPPLEVTGEAAALQDVIDRMGRAMQQARDSAHQGDIFTPAVARVMRDRLRKAAHDRGYDVGELLTFMNGEADYETAAAPSVNARYRWRIGSLLPPCLLQALPALPDELQYRLVGRHLILVDLHAELVIDVLPGALEET